MITLKLFRLSCISALMPPTLFKFLAFLRFTSGDIILVNNNISKAGANAAAPSLKCIHNKNIPAPTIVAILPINCINDCEKNWLSLSVSLFTRDIRSPALFWLKKSTGNCCSLLKMALRKVNSMRCPTPPISLV